MALLLVAILWAASAGATNVRADNPPLATVVVADGLDEPIFVTHAPDDPTRIFIIERIGKILIVKNGALLETPFLDIHTLINTNGERGLLGLAFHPDYDSNGFFYVHYNETAGDTVIARYAVSTDADVGDPNSEQIVLTIDQPHDNHNGGWIGFGPDDYLYIAMGDGGSSGGAGAGGNAQDTTDQLLGKMLRVDVDADDFPANPNKNYAIPVTNPFVNKTGDDEVWAYGLRNPWRCSFDRQIGDLWIADVGRREREELNFQPADGPGGENYGWRCMEGNRCYAPEGCTLCFDASLTYPIHEYWHALGDCSIIGGYVYRGSAIPGLQGTYFFGDYCSGRIWSMRYDGNAVTELQARQDELVPPGLWLSAPYSFGEDAMGEIYICNRSRRVLKIVPGSGQQDGQKFKVTPLVATSEFLSEEDFSALGVPSIDGESVAFTAFDEEFLPGLYLLDLFSHTLIVIADTTTPIPGGTGTFTGFGSAAPSVDDGNVAFVGYGDQQEGIYVHMNGTLYLVVDQATPVPGGIGTFTIFDRPAISGMNVAFHAADSAFFDGVYAFTGGLVAHANTVTLIPGTGEFFDGFGPNSIVIEGAQVAFQAFGQTQEGIYGNIDGPL